MRPSSWSISQTPPTTLSLGGNPIVSRRNPIVEAVQKTKNSIVTVRVPRPNGARDMIGTGVIIDERGFIITNRHVVAGAKEVKIRLFDGTELNAEIQLAEPRGTWPCSGFARTKD